jgi:hypothetical protein
MQFSLKNLLLAIAALAVLLGICQIGRFVEYHDRAATCQSWVNAYEGEYLRYYEMLQGKKVFKINGLFKDKFQVVSAAAESKALERLYRQVIDYPGLPYPPIGYGNDPDYMKYYDEEFRKLNKEFTDGTD